MNKVVEPVKAARAKPQHTSGPWECLEWERANRGTDWNVWGPKGSNHSITSDLQGDFGSEADARLIAASPELLEAAWDLVELIDAVAPAYSESPVLAHARHAISKATSSSSPKGGSTND